MLDESDQIAVIRGLRDGNREAWTALYDGYCADVWRFVGRLMGNRAADVADVVQEIFLAAARAARQFDSSRGTLWSWLAGIAHNQVSAFWRQAERTAKFRVFADADSLELWKSLDGCRSPDRVCEQRELVDFVRVILAQLSPDYTALLIAKYADEETLEELARRFGISVEATKSKLARARREFRATFESITRESKDSSFVQHRRVAPRSERDSKA